MAASSASTRVDIWVTADYRTTGQYENHRRVARPILTSVQNLRRHVVKFGVKLLYERLHLVNKGPGRLPPEFNRGIIDSRKPSAREGWKCPVRWERFWWRSRACHWVLSDSLTALKGSSKVSPSTASRQKMQQPSLRLRGGFPTCRRPVNG